MDTSYEELKAITDHQYEVLEQTGKITLDFHQQIVDLLNKYGIKLRQKDGTNPKATFSIPTSRPDVFVIGIRYLKQDGTKTEDHFLFQKDQGIERCYGKKLENLLPEYKGSHKAQR